jgi:guanylate kinase
MLSNIKGGAILILSGPSGCGKSSMVKKLFEAIPKHYFSVSSTTREKRDGEQEGVDYLFTSKEEFEKDIVNGNFLEWAEVHGNYYGTSIKPVMKAVDEEKLVVFDIDVQGHDIVRKKLDHLTTSVFITTPSLEELENRLTCRGTDSDEVIKKRISNAKEEIKYINKYDYILINDDLESASDDLINIAKAAKSKTSLFDNEKIAKDWLD